MPGIPIKPNVITEIERQLNHELAAAHGYQALCLVRKSKAWTDEMIERVRDASCAGGLGDLDRHIERYLTART